jgi:DNA-binding NarL/FixJ family response regulator
LHSLVPGVFRDDQQRAADTAAAVFGEERTAPSNPEIALSLKRQRAPTASRPEGGGPAKRARILVVDDHPIVREGLVGVMNRTPDMTVCAEAETTFQALEALKAAKPDLAVVDISLGERSGIDLIKDFKIRMPELLIVVHSMHDESLYAERCLRAGAKGYVMKQESPQRLLQAIRRVLRGEISLSETMTKRLLHRFSEKQSASPLDLLTDREFQVLDLIGRGHPTREIARLLHLSGKTVQTHREHLKEKLNLKDAIALVKYAVQWVDSQG